MINKVIAFKQKSEADDARQKAMDKHLVFLVKQTERYTSLLADNLESGGAVGMNIPRSPRSAMKKRAIQDVDKNEGEESQHEQPSTPNLSKSSVNSGSLPKRRRHAACSVAGMCDLVVRFFQS
jgi:hypothetical protein